MGKKKRRNIKQRIEDKKAELAELETKQKGQELASALDEGLVSKENEAEFKKLQKEVTILTKAAKVADGYNRDDLQASIETLRDRVSESMRDLIDDETGDDDEYEEE